MARGLLPAFGSYVFGYLHLYHYHTIRRPAEVLPALLTMLPGRSESSRVHRGCRGRLVLSPVAVDEDRTGSRHATSI